MSTTTAATPKFQHVTIIFPPGEENFLRKFYVDVIGFREKPIPKVVKPLGWIWFYTGEEGVELHCVPEARSVPDGPRISASRSMIWMIIGQDSRQLVTRSSKRGHYHFVPGFLLGIRSTI